MGEHPQAPPGIGDYETTYRNSVGISWGTEGEITYRFQEDNSPPDP
jgi:hypothetical protein